MKWLPEKLESFADRTAIIDSGKKYSYSDLTKKIKYYLQLFNAQFTNGNTVALSADYSFGAIAAFIALYESNQVISLFVSESEKERDTKLKVLQPDYLIDLTENECLISEWNPNLKHQLIHELIRSENAGLVLFTSGTTGEPKAILHNLDTLVNQYKREYTKDLNLIPLLGFDHIGGLDMLLSQLAIGATLTIPQNRTPKHICESIEKYKVNVISASPTFLNLLLLSEAYNDYNLSSLQIIGYGSEPMPAWLLNKLNAVFPTVVFQQKYGLSETNAIRIRSKSKDSLFFKIDDSSVEFRVIDNELWLRSPSVFSGYLDVTDNSGTKDGWFNTGDMVETDAEGYMKVLGRKSDIINVGGEKVFPAEVESALAEIPFIKDCQVFAEKSLITGNIISANVVSSSDKAFSEQKNEIRAILIKRLNRYKIPVKFYFVDAITYNDRMKKVRKIQ